MIEKKGKYIPEKLTLNLVPIMDAVFILIFFLLFSVQYIKLREIEAQAPVVSTVKNKQKEEKHLNLKIKILKNTIQIFTGVEENLYFEMSKFEASFSKKIKMILMKLRRSFPDDDYAILLPEKTISYKEIVEVIELIQILPDKQKEIFLKKNGKDLKINKIFSQVVLEPLDES